MIMKFSLVVAALASFTAMTAQAHIGLSKPCGRYHPSAGCPSPPAGQSVDYNINSPIGTHSNPAFPICKHTVPYTQRAVYNAGQIINTEYSVGAPHGGGHCQYALSYDGGKTWVVIKTILRECFRNASGGTKHTIPVQIPSDAPSGKVTFMWLWNNAVGNRELYSNCADIEIKGTNGGKLTGVEPLIANYGPSSVYIGEFSSGQNDGREEFAKRKPITVTIGGSGSEQPSATKPTETAAPEPTEPAPQLTVTVTKTVTKTEVIKPTCSP